MTSLGLGNPPILHKGSGAARTDPNPRQVVLWVGVADPVLSNFRDRLPQAVQRMLECAECGLPHCVGAFEGRPMWLRRIFYDKRPVGYGILIAEWMTIHPKAKMPSDYTTRSAAALVVLKDLGLNPIRHLTDRR